MSRVFNELSILSLIDHDSIDVNATLDGEFSLVARIGKNNNIHSFIEYKPTADLFNSLSINLNGSVGKCFYHEKNYATTQNVHVV